MESYKATVEGLAEYMGEGCEIVLHSLENIDASVIKIMNGGHSGRKEGAPITDLALSMLSKITRDAHSDAVSYITKSRTGESVKACTIVIRGEKNRIIGLLCINYYLNTPLVKLLQTFSPAAEIATMRENFVSDPKQLVFHAVSDAENQVASRTDVLPSNKNKEVVSILNQQGIFQIKNSVSLVAEAMGISKNTVYLHLRNLGEPEQHISKT